MYNWVMIHDLSNYGFLRVDSTDANPKNVDIGDINFLESWYGLMDEYIEHFGLNEQYEELLKDKLKIAENMAKLLTTNNFLYRTKYRIIQEKLRSKVIPDKVSLNELVSDVSKYMSYRINTKEITVSEFYSNHNSMKRQNG